MEIERGSIRIEGAVTVSGFTDMEIRTLINRERLFPEMDRKHGRLLSFTIQQLFILAAAKALIGVGFSIRSACDAIRPCQIYGTMVHDGELSLAAGKEGHLTGFSGAHIAVSIVIRPWALFESMKTGLIEIYGPEAVAELEQLKTVKPARKKPRNKGAS